MAGTLILAGGTLSAQEQSVVGPIAGRLAQVDSFASPFTATFASTGSILIQPGASFSEGEYEEGVQLPYLASHSETFTYPASAIREGWQGNAVLAIAVNTDGSVGETMVMQSSGHSVLDDLATEVVKSWLFHPATKDGAPIVECIQIPISFTLDHA